MLNLFGLDVNKWVVYIICIVLGTGIVTGGYYLWKHGIEVTAQLEFDNAQLKQVIADQNKYIEETKAINDAQNKALNDLSAQNTVLTANLKELDDYLNSAETLKGDRPSSEILKNTIRALKKLN